jgi:hypothetical protein
MDLWEFVELVQQMRTAQKLYFRERTPRTLAAAKSLEHEVDRVIERLTHPRAEVTLFDLIEGQLP